MARTAPAINGTPTYQQVSFHWIDASGDKRSDSVVLPAGATVAQIEDAAEELGAHSNASLYKVEQSAVYEGDGSKTNANPTAPRNSVYDNVVGLLRNITTRKTQNVFIPAPTPDLFSPEETDNVDTSPTGFLAGILTAYETMLGAAAWIPVSARYTERREINQKQNF